MAAQIRKTALRRFFLGGESSAVGSITLLCSDGVTSLIETELIKQRTLQVVQAEA